jgi:hypothetical protein
VSITGAWAAAGGQREREEFAAAELAAELGCEVTRYPALPGKVEARYPLPGLTCLIGTPAEVRKEVREAGLRLWWSVAGTQGRQ